MNEERERKRAPRVGLRERQQSGWFNSKTGELVQGLAVLPTDIVADIGCGEGGIVNFCANIGAYVYFVDADAARVDSTSRLIEASAAHGFSGIVSDCNPIPIESEKTDITICTEVLEHVPDPVALVDELIRITRPGGKLLISVPDARSERLVETTAPAGYFKEPNHIRTFDVEEFRGLIADSGLEILHHGFVGAFWSVYWPLAWLTSEPGSGLPVDSDSEICQHWVSLWSKLQDYPGAEPLMARFSELLPKTQYILARKMDN